MRIFRHYISWYVLFLVCADGTIIFASVYAGLFIKLFGFQALWLGTDPIYPKVLVLVFVAITISYIGNLYDLSLYARKKELITRMILAFLSTALIVAAASFFFPPLRLTRKAYCLSLGLSLPALVCFRLFYYWVIRTDQLQEKVLIIGNTKIAQMIFGELKSGNNPGFAVLGLVMEDATKPPESGNTRDFAVLRPGSENSPNPLEKYR